MPDSNENQAAPAKPEPRLIWLGLALALVIAAWGIYYFTYYRKPVSTLDGFANCVTKSGAKMYGAWWCPHCADQKELFGFAFQYVNYIECSPKGQKTENDTCKQAGVKNFPTWRFSDGTSAEGTLQIKELSDKTGCKLP
jgi:hypothetical protein